MKPTPRPTGFSLSLFAAALAAVVIGCGGGGGGGTSSTNASTGTTTNPTTGTNPTNTGSTANPTTGTPTTGTTASPIPGTLPANTIFFAELPTGNATTYDVHRVNPDGSGDSVVYSGIPRTVSSFAINPYTSGQVVFANLSGTTYQLAFANNFDTASATPIVTQAYAAIGSIQVTQDGTAVVYTAEPTANGPFNLYVVPLAANATPTTLDTDVVGTATVAGGGTVLYDKFTTTAGIYRTLVTGGAPTAVVAGTSNNRSPQISRSGSRFAYLTQATDGRYQPASAALDGTSVTTTILPAAYEATTPSLNGDATAITFVDRGSDATLWGLYRIDANGANLTPLKVSTNVLPGTYWSDAQGRGLASFSLSLNTRKSK